MRWDRPRKRALLESLVQQPEPGALPVQELDSIASTVAEPEQVTAERIEVEHVLDGCGEPVDLFAHVRRAMREIDANRGRQAQHDRITRSNRVRSRSSNPVVTRIDTSRITISIGV